MLEKLVYRFSDGIANFNRLEKWKLWLDSSDCWLAYKDGTLQAGWGYNKYIGLSKSNPEYDN